MLSTLQQLRTAAANASEAVNGKLGGADPSTLGVIFMACLCAVLPLDISQLSFALIGAALYAVLQRTETVAPKKKVPQVVGKGTPHPANARAAKPKPKANINRPLSAATSAPKAPVRSPNAEMRQVSAQPIAAPVFQSKEWEGEIRELLNQITPTPETDEIVNDLAHRMKQHIKNLIPEVEVTGFASGNLTFGKAFGVAVPEVDIVASASPEVLFRCFHRKSTSPIARGMGFLSEAYLQGGLEGLDARKLQKTAIRLCCDRLVSHAGFKFRRSGFRGQEPKVTLLVPPSVGVCADSIAIDFSVNVVTPFYNAALLTECGQMDPRAKELMLLVKRWAKDRGICHAAKGHLSPYMWGLLSIFFLQAGVTQPLLPPLEEFELSSGLAGPASSGKGSAHDLPKPKWKPSQCQESDKSVATLFKEFVRFYGTHFDWRNEAVSIRAGRRAPPALDLPLHIVVSDDSGVSQVGPSVEDPFQAATNLGDCMNAVSFLRLKEELSRAEALCEQGCSLSELLEPWAPPALDEQAAEDGEQRHGCTGAAQKPVTCKSAEKPLATAPSSASADWRRDAADAQAALAAMPRRR